MAEHDFTINFVVNTQQTEAARAAEKAGYKDVEAVAKESTKAIFDAQTVAARARGQLIDRENRRAIKAAADEADAWKRTEKDKAAAAQAASKARSEADRVAAQAAKEAREQSAAWNATLRSVAGSLTQIISSAGGIATLTAAVNFVADAFERARTQAYAAGQMAADYRDALREIAGLKGQAGIGTSGIKADLALRARTLQTAADARKFQEVFLGGAQSSIDTGKIGAKDAQKYQEYLGGTQAMKGESAEAYGALGAMIPTISKGPISAEKAIGTFAQLQKIAQPSNIRSGAFSKQMGETGYLTQTGMFSDIRRQAAVGAVLGIGTPETIGEGLKQFTRMTKGKLNDFTPGPNAEVSPGDYLKDIGSTDQMDALDIAEKMVADVEKAEAAARKEGKQLDILGYLAKRGFNDEESVARFMQFYGKRQEYKQIYKPMMTEMPTMAEAMAPLQQYQATDPGALAKRAEIGMEQTQIAQGAGPLEFMTTLKKTAFSRLQQTGKISGNFDQWKDSAAVTNEMRDMLQASANKAGVSTATGPTGPNYLSRGGLFGTERSEAEGYKELADLIQAKGGNVIKENQDKIDEHNKKMLESTVASEKKLGEAVSLLQAAKPPPPVLNGVPGGNVPARPP